MLNEHTINQLRTLRLDGMVRAIEDQASSAAAAALGFEERLSLLVQREVAWRDDRRVTRLLKAARLKVSAACVEEINWRASRGLDKSMVTALACCDWLRHGQSLLITGATGCGDCGHTTACRLGSGASRPAAARAASGCRACSSAFSRRCTVAKYNGKLLTPMCSNMPTLTILSNCQSCGSAR